MNGLHHIEIYVSDLKRTKEFYSWLLTELGYKQYQDWEEGFSFIQGGTYIVFVQVKEKYLEYGYHRSRIGLNHLAFCVETPEDVNQLTQKLRNKNCCILYEDRHPYAGGPNHYAVYFEDPDRIKLEVAAEKASRQKR